MKPCSSWCLAVTSLWVCAGVAGAQVRNIPKEGIEGIAKDAIEFAPEHDFRRENNLGLTTPAAPDTPPGSTDPQNIEGIWLSGRTYVINADGTFTNTQALPGRATNGPRGVRGAAEAGGGAVPGPVPGAAPPPGAGGPPRMQCRPSSPFSMGMPGRIVQTADAIYIFNNGTSNTHRRILLKGQHPANLTPTIAGHSIGRWEGEWLVIETVGLKGSAGFGMFGGDGAGTFTAASKVTERIHKIANHLQLEHFVTIEDPSYTEPVKRRLTSYYRPDLDVVEAPCEEYSDPFEGTYAPSPNQGGQRVGTIPGAPGTPGAPVGAAAGEPIETVPASRARGEQ